MRTRREIDLLETSAHTQAETGRNMKVATRNKESLPRKRSRPGRPEGPSVVRETIMDVAEVEFADRGFAGVSVREIAEKAAVNQALISYYFGSKAGLFTEVYMRRSSVIAERRQQNLDVLLARTPSPDVRDLVRAFLSPAFEMRGEPGGRAFIRLQARLHTEPEDFAYELRSDAYDVSMRDYAEILCRRLSHLRRETVYWRLIHVVGAYLYVISDAHRLSEISQGLASAASDPESLEQLVAFCAAGLLAPDLD